MSVVELLALPGVEERAELAGSVGVLAFHGGLEGGTEIIASSVAAATGASLYLLVQPPTVRWHLPSHVVGAQATPALGAFLDHIDIAIAIHGYGRPDRPRQILVGGRNRDVAIDLGRALRSHLPDCRTIDDLDDIPAEMRGLHPDNPVNRCRRQGVQLELPPSVRGSTGRWMDDNSACTPLPGVVDALIDTVRRWS